MRFFERLSHWTYSSDWKKRYSTEKKFKETFDIKKNKKKDLIGRRIQKKDIVNHTVDPRKEKGIGKSFAKKIYRHRF